MTTTHITAEPPSDIAKLRAALLECARKAEALKRECGMDPESPQAVRNLQYQSISTTAHIALGTIRGPAAEIAQPATPEPPQASAPSVQENQHAQTHRSDPAAVAGGIPGVLVVDHRDGSGKLDPDEEDPVALWAEIHRLRTAVQGPAGFASWQEAATAERVRRVAAERTLAQASALQAAIPAQQPVAWRYTDSRGHFRYRGFVPGFDTDYPMLKPIPLYASPTAQPAPAADVMADARRYAFLRDSWWFAIKPADLGQALTASQLDELIDAEIRTEGPKT